MLSASSRRTVRRRVVPVAGLLAVLLTASGCAGQSLADFAVGVAAGADGAGPGVSAASPSQETCADGDFSCRTVAVPADHFTAGSPTWHITYAVHKADVDSRGVLLVATGGPGSSGIGMAEDYLGMFSSDVTDHYDVVLFDQRGIGLSHPFHCDRALGAYDPPVLNSSSAAAARDRYAARTDRFVRDCFAEAGVQTKDAGLFSTRQAAEDLEAIRTALGADELTLYGESYGTQLLQTYAAAHPDHVRALLLDGVVDLTTDALGYAKDSAHAYSDVLTTTLLDCDRDSDCADDAPGSELAGYDALAARLRSAPAHFDYPLPDGTTERRTFTLSDLHDAATGSVSDLTTRELLQRSLNAARNGDLVPLERLTAENDGVDPDTGEAFTDPTFSDALYLAVECSDYSFAPPGTSGRAALDTWLAAAAAARVDSERLGSAFYNDLTCLFWPPSAPAARSAAVPDPPYPRLLLTADTDPNTPTVQAERIDRTATGHTAMGVQRGGPHVVYGRGDDCIDQLVDGTILTGRLPAKPVTVCPGPVADPYQESPPKDAQGYTTARHTADVVLAGVLDDPASMAWDGTDPLTLGCDAGGTAHYAMTDDVLTVELHGCAFTPFVPIDGTVHVSDSGSGNPSMSVVLPFGHLSMSSSGALTGEFRGQPVR